MAPKPGEPPEEKRGSRRVEERLGEGLVGSLTERTDGRRKRSGSHGQSRGRAAVSVVGVVGVDFILLWRSAYSMYVECIYCTLTLQCTVPIIEYAL